MTMLSVNINKIATLRNARGENTPNLVQVAIDCERFGADGITIHPRPDERHITEKDVYELAKVVTTEYNIEGFPNSRFMKLVSDVRPTQATLVPDAPGVLTSNAGWEIKKNETLLTELAVELKKLNVRSSIFVDTNLENIEYAAKCGIDRIELYTGPYAEEFKLNPKKAIER
ncbi:MAG: pyridoxine 5'-phosphate synthase, partial [Flavobacteriales bacterium]